MIKKLFVVPAIGKKCSFAQMRHLYLVKPFLGNFYSHLAIFIDIWRFLSGRTGNRVRR